MKDKIENVLSKIAKEKINGMEIPDTIRNYITLRRRAMERMMIEAQDTAHMHGAWVFDYATTDVDILDELGWILLYEEISKMNEGLPLSFIRGLSFTILPDKMEKTLKCDFNPMLFDAPGNMVAVLFDGAKLGLWEMDDAKNYSAENYPQVPLFDKEEWKDAIIQKMGGMETDMEDIEIPKGGLDVFLL